jgi:4'-phosphopantetheinyl transferase
MNTLKVQPAPFPDEGTGHQTEDCQIPRLTGNFDLRDGQIHAWHFDFQDISSRFRWDTLLNHQEKQRADRFRFAKDVTCFVTCRGVLRALLAAYLRTEPSRLVFETSDQGKPALCGPELANQIHFNISHSGTMALMGFVRGREIGVDLERMRTDFDVEAIADRFFSAAEKAALSQIPPENKHSAFFHAWTRKEAFLKAKGGGLSMPLSGFDVSVAPGLPAELLATRPDSSEVERWYLQSLQVADDYAASMAIGRIASQRAHLKVQPLRLAR